MNFWDWLEMQLHHEFDSNGVCKHCGWEQPMIHFIAYHPNPNAEGPVQTVNFMHPVTLMNGESLSVQFPLTDSSGEVLRGNFLAEVKPGNVIKVIGRG